MIACGRALSRASLRGTRGGYSRLVSLLKIGLPLAALALLSTVFLVTSPDDFKGTGLVLSDVDRQTLNDGMQITRPRIAGATGNNDSYDFTANIVYSSSQQALQLTAEGLSGTIDMAAGRRIDLSGDLATFDQKASTVTLSGAAHLVTSDGYVADLQGLVVDLATGTVTSKGALTADGPVGHVEAGQLRISSAQGNQIDKIEDAEIWFGDGVKVTFVPGNSSAGE